MPPATRQGRDGEAIGVGSADVAFIEVVARALDWGLRRGVLLVATAMRRGPVECAAIELSSFGVSFRTLGGRVLVSLDPILCIGQAA